MTGIAARPRRILVVGDSHVYALQSALEERPAPPGLRIDVLRIRSERIPGITFEEALEMAAGLEPGDILGLALRGNKAAIMGMIQHPRPFAVLMPEDDRGPDPGLEVIPHRVMAHVFEDALERGHGPQIRALAAAGPAHSLCLRSPGPKADAAFILRAGDGFFRSMGIETAGVSPAALRLRLWRLEQEALARFCAAQGLPCLHCPPGTLEDGGFLRREFWSADSTHGNAAYGQRVIDQLAAWTPGI